MYILLAIIIFGLLIFIHELGHFIAARLCGVKVLEFAIGMGPKILSVKSKKSGTVYSLRLFPIGGFVGMLGENGMDPVQGSSNPDGENLEPSGDSDELKENDQKDSFFINRGNKNDPEDSTMKSEWEGTVVDAETAKHAYCNQSVWKRILISIAGPAMNVLLGFILMLVIVLMGGQNSVGTTVVSDFHVVYTGEEAYQGLQNGDYIVGVDGVALDSYAHLKQLVAEKENGSFKLVVQRLNEKKTDVDYIVLENVVLNSELIQNPFITNSLSEQCGLQKGDRVVKVNGTAVHTAYELSYELMMQGYRPISLTVVRAGQKLTLENVTLPNEIDPSSGVTMGTMDFRVYGESDFHLGTVLKHTWFRSVSTVKMVFDSLFGLFSGRYGFEAVSGPVGITKTITEMAQLGYMYVLNLVTVISINLGVMNLLPLPALDGGHLLIYAIEVIRRKPLKPEVEGVINFVGLVLLLSLAVIILIKDIIAL